MPLVINTNIQSLNAQRNLSKTLMPLQTAMQRLSSGMRINSAKDDAAGLAIAVRMNSQMKGLTQAVRNANDAVSLVQTAEGAIDEMTNALQRIRELAVQSANASNTALDRGATDKEVQQLVAEVDRIATQTQFNNQTLLDGTLGSKAFQVGANAGQTISVALAQGLKAGQIGQIADSTATTATSVAIVGGDNIQINDNKIIATVAGGAGQTTSSAWSVANAINASGVSGVTATAVTGTTTSNVANKGIDFAAAADAYKLDINGVTVFNYTATAAFATEGLTQQQLIDRINMYSSQTGVGAALNGTYIELTAADGRDIGVDVTVTAGATAAFNADSTTHGFIELSSSDDIKITGDASNKLGFGAGATTITKDAQTLSNIDVKTVTGANNTMKRIDSALNVISNMRADLGAVLNRFQSTTANLSNVLENITAAHSRIMDADFAAETANITKAQILQQAGISVLAQANTLPQNVLTLLRQ